MSTCACASEILQLRDRNPAVRAASRLSVADDFSWRSRKMKKGRASGPWRDVRMGSEAVETNTNLILRRPLALASGRLEGWKRAPCVRPSFETLPPPQRGGRPAGGGAFGGA